MKLGQNFEIIIHFFFFFLLMDSQKHIFLSGINKLPYCFFFCFVFLVTLHKKALFTKCQSPGAKQQCKIWHIDWCHWLFYSFHITAHWLFVHYIIYACFLFVCLFRFMVFMKSQAGYLTITLIYPCKDQYVDLGPHLKETLKKTCPLIIGSILINKFFFLLQVPKLTTLLEFFPGTNSLQS